MHSTAVLILMLITMAGCRLKDHRAPDTGGKIPERNGVVHIMDSTALTTIQWLDSTHKDFGKIPEGQQLEVIYHFRNSGSKPLVISKVEASCGCTVPDQSGKPVAPGKEGVIRAVFNSEGRVGPNHKTLYVIANTKGAEETQLQFNVEVVKKKW